MVDTPTPDDIEAVARAVRGLPHAHTLFTSHSAVATCSCGVRFPDIIEHGRHVSETIAAAAIQTLIERGWKKPG